MSDQSAPSASTTDQRDNTLIGEPPSPARRRLLLYLLLAGLLAGLVWELAESTAEFQHARIAWGERLAAVADDEQRLIHDWLGEQGNYARLVAAQTGFGAKSASTWEVAIFDRDRHLSLEEPHGSAEGLPLDSLLAAEPASQIAVALTPAFAAHRSRVSLSVPVPGSAADAGSRLILSQDASISFNSLLSNSGPNLRTGESFLVDRQGERVRLLTPLRFTPRPPTTAGSQEGGLALASETAAAGTEGFDRFIDYRGETVLAVTRTIAGTPWGLVVKIDETEAMAPSRHELVQRAVRSLLLLIALVAIGWIARQSERLRTLVRASRRDMRYRLLIAHAHDAVFVAHAKNGRIIEANKAAERLYGRTADELCSMSLLDLRSPNSITNIQDRLLEGAAGEHYESRHRRRDGSEVPVEVSGGRLPGNDEPLVLAIIRDISPRKLAEARTARLDRLIRSIAEIGQSVVNEKQGEHLLQNACDTLVRGCGFKLAWFGQLASLDGAITSVSAAGAAIGYLSTVPFRMDEGGNPSEPAVKALRSQKSVIVADAEATLGEPWRQAATRFGWRSAIAVPFTIATGESLVLAVYDAGADRFPVDQQQLLERLAGHLALALDALESNRALVEAEARFRESEAQLSLAISSTGIGLWDLDVATGAARYSREWKALLGYAEGDDIGNSIGAWERLTLPEDLARMRALVDPYIENPVGLLQSEFRMRHKDGTLRWILSCASAVETAPEGRARRLIGYHIDVTKPRQAAEELRQAYERLRLVSRATHDVVWDWDIANNTVWWSGGLATLLGYDSSEVATDRTATVGWWRENIHPDDRERVIESENRAIAQGDALWNAEYRFRNASGEYLDMDDRGYLVSNDQGRPVRMVGAMIDITARRLAEREVLQVNAELEKRVLERTESLASANRELESFAYSISHDLRAPLRAISGFATILDEQHAAGLDEEGRRLLAVIRRNALRMGALIDDLLALSRASRQELRAGDIDMNALLHSVWTELRAGAEDSVQLTATSLPGAWGDASLLRKLWTNLLANAIKFTTPREHRRVEVGGVAEDGGVTYSIRDNGVGFDMAHADKLFGVFQRLHGRDEFEGTGVGLAMVQLVVQRHGGRAWFDSVVDQGANFYFWLPRGQDP